MVIEPTLRRRLLVAGALGLLALGLPWTNEYRSPGRFAPGFCSTSYDADGYGTVSCSPGTYFPGFDYPQRPGFTLDVRVYLVIVLVVGALGLLRRSAVLVAVALAAGAMAVVVNANSLPGQFAWVAALAVSAWAVTDAGLLGPAAQVRLSRLRRRFPRPRAPHPAAPHPRAAPGGSPR